MKMDNPITKAKDPSSVDKKKNKNKNKINLGIYIAPTQAFQADLGTESRVCYPGNTADR
jgi:hypothetical protein